MAKKQSSANRGVVAAEIGAGVLAAAAAGAGYYFYGAKGAKKHREAASKWAKDMKNEVVKEAKKVKKLDQKVMTTIVDRATRTYQGAKNVKREDLVRAANELKKNWKTIAAELAMVAKQSGNAAKQAAKTATVSARRAASKKPVKKVAKKASKKTAKKR
ncbi:MAG: hypothetical protein P4M11_05290 [Candidatus Pacebacteria bacterium]|nr:hypothetical protein [Candidatus Paceibacterota bacterium]